MKRVLLGTLWIGSVTAVVALTFSLSRFGVRTAAALDEMLRLSPNETLSFGNCLLVIALSFGLAWVMLELQGVLRRVALFLLVIAELIGGAWVLARAEVSFSPWPAIIGVLLASALAIFTNAGRAGRQRRRARRIFGDRLGQQGHDRLSENKAIDFSQPVSRTATFVFCEIANAPELIDELSPPDCARLSGEFIDLASKHFLKAGGYLHAADGEGVGVLFGFPNETTRHALEAAQAALAFRDQFRALAGGRPETLGKIDLRLGISSGTVVATLRDDRPGRELMIAGEPLELARRLARANQIYGSEILIGPRTFRIAGKEVLARPMDFLRSAEAHERLEVYELLALAKTVTAEEVARRDHFWTAVVYFRERRWNEAFAEFNRARNAGADPDRPLQWYLRRLEPLCLKMATDPAPVAEPFAPLS
jgi:class 3 adenylate cyclase